ncbi:amidohydrolase family protein [Streptomyces pactum]|uniref:amidohydrolase family protein n=1 Tax=Streptomyces pactum TaxID=68249 RepID=UPI003555E85B
MPLPALIDHHCHGVVRTTVAPGAFAALLTESDAPPAPGTSFFDTQLGFAVRRWCPPLLGLLPHCPPERYLARRAELGAGEVTRRLLRASGIRTFLVDTGLPGDLTTPGELAEAAGGDAAEVVRLESLAERVADHTPAAGAYPEAAVDAVRRAARTAVAFKSVAAYRCGLDFAPGPPAPAEVRSAAGRWLTARRPGTRLTDPVLIRHLLWAAAGTGLPLQLHTGFGDPDLDLRRGDPLLLTGFIRAVRHTGCPLVLLHGYPYHRSAACLAQLYPHVYADIGLAVGHAGVRAAAVVAEALELAPFGKLLFSTDAYGLPELYLVGARLFTGALSALLERWVAEGAWSAPDAARVAALVCADNARRLYRLSPVPPASPG